MSIRNVRRFAPIALLCSACLGASPVLAQDRPTIELTPFFGYTFGGSFDVFDFELGQVSFEVDDSQSYGLIVDFPISRSFQIEALVFRQASALTIDEGIFGPSFEVSDMNIDHFEAGVLWQGAWGQVQPFFTGGMGLAYLDPEVPSLDSETRFAFNFGGGVKTMFTQNFGLRAEGRWLLVTLPEDDNDPDCCYYDYYGEGDVLSQGHFSLGLIFAF
jgi:hypothetical protein